MTFRRKEKPDRDAEFARMLAELAVAYEEGVQRCREVALADEPDKHLRAEALATALRIAYINRATCEALLYLDLLDHVAEEHCVPGVMAASARLAYSLTASVGPDGQPETILSIDELDGLPAQYELEEWLDFAGIRPVIGGDA
jgi:hypothetical protein